MQNFLEGAVFQRGGAAWGRWPPIISPRVGTLGPGGLEANVPCHTAAWLLLLVLLVLLVLVLLVLLVLVAGAGCWLLVLLVLLVQYRIY